jgi:hypothetical protein
MEGSTAPQLWQLVFSGILGLTYVLAGYRTMRFTARMTSAVLFMGLGSLIAHHVHSPVLAGGILAAAAVIGYLLGNAFYYVNVGVLGAGAGVVLAAVFCAAIGSRLSWGSGISGGLAGLILAILVERPVGIFGTSIIGSALAMGAMRVPLLMIGEPGSRPLAWGSLALFLGLVAVGCAVQARTTRHLPREPKPQNRPSTAI